jgi:DNA-binding PadR family transcriptional regulator
MGSRRFFQYGELPLVLLVLLERSPMSGYELMNELARIFGPAYRPSPGSVYPALKALAAESLVETVNTGEPATYAPTDGGRQVVFDRRDDVASIEHRTDRSLTRDGLVEASLARLRARVTAIAGRVAPEKIASELDETADRLEKSAHADL